MAFIELLVLCSEVSLMLVYRIRLIDILFSMQEAVLSISAELAQVSLVRYVPGHFPFTIYSSLWQKSGSCGIFVWQPAQLFPAIMCPYDYSMTRLIALTLALLHLPHDERNNYM
jgi:hypothetical protein